MHIEVVTHNVQIYFKTQTNKEVQNNPISNHGSLFQFPLSSSFMHHLKTVVYCVTFIFVILMSQWSDWLHAWWVEFDSQQKFSLHHHVHALSSSRVPPMIYPVDTNCPFSGDKVARVRSVPPLCYNFLPTISGTGTTTFSFGLFLRKDLPQHNWLTNYIKPRPSSEATSCTATQEIPNIL
jgi:hypothetical protein